MGATEGGSDYEDLAKRLHGRIRGFDEEYILCAAIHFKDGKDHLHQPVNIQSGFVVCGRRHHNVYLTVSIFQTERVLDDEQGFVTSKDRFVDRKEGGEIAFKVGQTK